MTVKKHGPLKGFHRAVTKPSIPRVSRANPLLNGPGMSRSRQPDPENMFAWTGITARTLADIPAGCICDWIYHKGVLEIKFPNALCRLRHKSD
jgi:hypothetical protein